MGARVATSKLSRFHPLTFIGMQIRFYATMKVLFSVLVFVALAVEGFGQGGQSPLAPAKTPAPTGPRTFLKLGDKAPDFALPNGDGKLVALSEYTQRSPVILVFYRGFW